MLRLKDLFKIDFSSKGGGKLADKIFNKYNITKEEREEVKNEIANGGGSVEDKYWYKVIGEDKSYGTIKEYLTDIDGFITSCSIKSTSNDSFSFINCPFRNYNPDEIYYISCKGAFYYGGMLLEYDNIEDAILKMSKLQYGDDYKEAYEQILNHFYSYFSKPVTYEEMYKDMINIITT